MPRCARIRTCAGHCKAVADLLIRRPPGLSPYEPVWRAMQAFTDARTPETPDELWVVEHEPVFT
ncbi:MAG: hypothetical protein ACM3KT_04860, partial [Deltaproteobacteria bacterium]